VEKLLPRCQIRIRLRQGRDKKPQAILTFPVEELQRSLVKGQDVLIDQFQDFPHVLILHEDGLILQEMGNVLAQFFVGVKQSVEGVHPSASYLKSIVST